MSKLATEYKNNSILTGIIMKEIEMHKLHFDLELNNLEKRNKNILVWRYFENSCSTCVEEEFLNLKKYTKYYGIENTVLMTTSNNNKSLKTFLSDRKMENFDLLLIPDSVLNISHSAEKKPFYFVLDSTFRPRMIFSPDQRVPGLTEKYFETVKKYFFTQNH